MRGWTIDDSAELYGIKNWGREFLRINAQGHIVIAPHGDKGGSVDLKELVDDLSRREIGLPILIRFTDMLEARIKTLAEAFRTSIREYEYQGKYRGVYPIKVNQQRHVVEDVVRFGRPYHMGLEAGSKPELLVVLAQLQDPEALIICNGYKDTEYIETAMMAQKLGRNPIIVVEKATELDLCLEVSTRLGLRPMIGMRAKLASRGAGRWEASTGDRAKFGLTIQEMVDGVEKLRAADMLDCLRLLHFHIGSQVSAIRSFKDALKEGARIYVELCRLGAPMGFFDVGGGLGVDYDGSSSNFESSVNYTVQEYAYDVISAIASACDEAEVKHPNIVTEAGRAMVAHHALLVFNVLGISEHLSQEDNIEAPGDDEPEVLRELHEAQAHITRKSYQAAWHDAVEAREQMLTMFNLGLLSLKQRALGERLFWSAAGRIAKVIRSLSYVPDEFEGLNKALADTYFCNFSVFQSMPDSWAVNQLFPIVPIHRLEERPTRQGVLADITCDSDGKVDRFIDLHDVKDVLELHPPNGQPYYLGVFLVGAYQEILGDLHNLFGDTNAVQVTLHRDGHYSLDSVVEGDTVTDVLSYVQYSRKELVRQIRESCELSLKEGRMTIEESARLMAWFQRGLEGYTYLE
jgi:arginine decarboxylase